ncbi:MULTISPECIES: phage antirepressor KilAC domain-containing protein [Comamonas]|uniref:phage antirepressor KilAC domain-containing protein n=1 Tax=Comamonas TaxID=283 RepID=UPI000620F9B7|nr:MULTISPECIES: phage antirepressor KilAC domain-containing protein [Comamonas]KKI11672.1 hypothetical protein XA67_23485 [Comamonas thiooxydans]BCX53958.1 hypothetical protein CTYAZ2_35380 [Comamonas testosteroni]
MSSIVINNTSLQVIEYMGKRVVTLAQVDSVHGRPEGTAGRNFREHKHRLIEGEDYFKVGADEFRRHLDPNHSKFASEDVILLAEPGYLMLVKSFTDDLAWSVQRQLTNIYFRTRSQARELSKLEVLQQALESEQARIKAEEALALAAPKAEFVDRYVQPGTGSMGVREVCKVLGAKLNEFTDFLLKRGLMYRTTPKSPLTPRAEHMHNGRFEAKTGTAEHGETSHAFVHYKFTPKGVEWIAGLWGQHQVRLKQSGGVTA